RPSGSSQKQQLECDGAVPFDSASPLGRPPPFGGCSPPQPPPALSDPTFGRNSASSPIACREDPREEDRDAAQHLAARKGNALLVPSAAPTKAGSGDDPGTTG
ncbi:hypothetical protein OY671_009366, partial [Metschnikowia pulcherrima]